MKKIIEFLWKKNKKGIEKKDMTTWELMLYNHYYDRNKGLYWRDGWNWYICLPAIILLIMIVTFVSEKWVV